MTYSIILLLEEKHEDFSNFVRNLYALFSTRDESFEILIIANGTGGFLRNELAKLQSYNGRLKAFELKAKSPQAVCLKAGIRESTGDIIIVCGSYQQIHNEALIQLLDELDDETDIISPCRQNRVDPPFNQLQSKIFNAFVRWITRSDFHDLNCSVKVFRRKVIEETQLYGNMYRFLPVLAEQKGFKIKEIKCEHYQESGQTGFYPLSSYLTRTIDILTLYFNTRFTRKPLRFFSCIGMTFLVAGLLTASYVFGQKILLNYPIGGRPILLLAMLFMVLGVQAASVGLLGEIIAFTHGRQKKEYTTEKTL